MKRALQAILIAPDANMRHAILIGQKTLTIREGHRNYTPGSAMICCHIEPWAVMVEIENVQHTTLGKVPPNDILADGFLDHRDAVQQLKRFYKDIDLNSDVTIVHWKNPQGHLVDNAR